MDPEGYNILKVKGALIEALGRLKRPLQGSFHETLRFRARVDGFGV